MIETQIQHGPRGRIVWADDNADMRDYVCRLLGAGGRFEVEAVADGQAALEAIRNRTDGELPDLVLADVMMPNLDGFGLLRELRSDPRLCEIPVILLSARAGEESRIEGIEAGADDYLVKPFSARELIARVETHAKMARLRREAATALRESEDRYRTLFNSIDEGFCVFEMLYDEAGAPVDYRFLEVNPAFEKHTGLTHAEGKTILELVPDHEKYWFETYGKVASTGEPVRFENRGEGMHRWFDVYAFRLGGPDSRRVAAIFTDITERKRTEEARAHLGAIIQSSDDAIISKTLNGVIQSWNDSAQRLFGYSAEEAIGQPITMLIPPDRLDEEPEIIERLRRGERVDHFETKRRRKDGALLDISLTISPVKDGQGHIIGASKTARDITEWKKTEEALREADRRKNEFLATLAHELRNPLAPLRTGLELLRIAANKPATTDKARAMMERQVNQLVHLVDDLLDVSRVTRGKIQLRTERVDLTTIVQHAVEASRSFIEASGHELTITLPDDPVLLQADPARLAQIFANLLNNAAKYTPAGGRLEIAAECREGQIAVTVRDSGIGISADHLVDIFDMFTQIDRSLEQSHGGLGIGLTLVKQLVDLHGGTVEVQSDGPGQGSAFTVRLPLPSAPDAESAAAPEPTAKSVHRRILVVDDNRDAAETLRAMLEMSGNEVYTAYDGLQALEQAEAFRPDVVLLDIGMPKLNGYDTAQKLRAEPWGKDLVLIALTGWGQAGDKQRTQAAGFDHHLVKPIVIANLETLLAGL